MLKPQTTCGGNIDNFFECLFWSIPYDIKQKLSNQIKIIYWTDNQNKYQQRQINMNI